jgi:hypothetical protein
MLDVCMMSAFTWSPGAAQLRSLHMCKCTLQATLRYVGSRWCIPSWGLTFHHTPSSFKRTTGWPAAGHRSQPEPKSVEECQSSWPIQTHTDQKHVHEKSTTNMHSQQHAKGLALHTRYRHDRTHELYTPGGSRYTKGGIHTMHQPHTQAITLLHTLFCSMLSSRSAACVQHRYMQPHTPACLYRDPLQQ